jgi:polyisoprenoid-binding protein YceI
VLAEDEIQTQVHFALDMQRSLFTVQAFASGLVAVVANSPRFAMRDMQGEVSFCPEAIQASSVDLTIHLSALELLDEVTREERRAIERVMFNDVLEIARYPTTQFRSSCVTARKLASSLYSLSLAGNLTLHGVTRDFGFDSLLMVGADTLRMQGSFSLPQSDYGLKIASVADGLFKLKDDLKFAFFLVACHSPCASSRELPADPR